MTVPLIKQRWDWYNYRYAQCTYRLSHRYHVCRVHLWCYDLKFGDGTSASLPWSAFCCFSFMYQENMCIHPFLFSASLSHIMSVSMFISPSFSISVSFHLGLCLSICLSLFISLKKKKKSKSDINTVKHNYLYIHYMVKEYGRGIIMQFIYMYM